MPGSTLPKNLTGAMNMPAPNRVRTQEDQSLVFDKETNRPAVYANLTVPGKAGPKSNERIMPRNTQLLILLLENFTDPESILHAFELAIPDFQTRTNDARLSSLSSITAAELELYLPMQARKEARDARKPGAGAGAGARAGRTITREGSLVMGDEQMDIVRLIPPQGMFHRSYAHAGVTEPFQKVTNITLDKIRAVIPTFDSNTAYKKFFIQDGTTPRLHEDVYRNVNRALMRRDGDENIKGALEAALKGNAFREPARFATVARGYHADAGTGETIQLAAELVGGGIGVSLDLCQGC